LKPKEAWRIFEEAIKNIDSIDQAAQWLKENPCVAKKMTGMGLLECFEEDTGVK
jgi:hypothetical protein